MQLVLSQTRTQWVLAIFLALIAGYLDGYGLLVLGTYVSFMSGNTTTTGLSSGEGNFHAALPSAIAVLSFVSGSFLGNVFIQSKIRHSHRLIFGVIAGLLATVAALELNGVRNPDAGIAMLSLAMGMMNPALSKIGAESVSLTFMTGMLSRVGGHLASAAGGEPLVEGEGRGDSHLARARIDTSIWAGFLVGAALSGIVRSHFRLWALVPPCLVMIGLGLFSESATPSPEKRITPSMRGLAAQR
jgi:uncharacterized membrane protein YoaK (UPF0700 family)